MITSTTTAQALLDIALVKLHDVPSGETFIVRDLFCGVDWKRVPLGTRIKLGSLFLIYVEHQGSSSVKKLEEKSNQKQQIYEKL